MYQLLINSRYQQHLQARQRGVSLIETMLALTIAAILTTIALPSFSALQNSGTINSTRQSLIQDIRLMRTYARSRRASAYLCAFDENGKCSRQANWQLGWMGFVDHNANRKYDAGDEQLIFHASSLPKNIRVVLHTRWKNIKINARGILRSSGHFRICDPDISGRQNMQIIRMNVHGRLSIERDKLLCA